MTDHVNPAILAGEAATAPSGGDVAEAAYLSTRRTNLCCPAWNLAAARERALELLDCEPGTLIVALGAKVRDAFHHPWRDQMPAPKFFTFSDHGGDPGTPHHFRVAYLPHPSGRNQIWNDPQTAIRARALLRELAPLVPWGAES